MTSAINSIGAVKFFFSSRRRHTRSKRDWSSDVCSSDLSRRSGRGSGPVVPRKVSQSPRLRDVVAQDSVWNDVCIASPEERDAGGKIPLIRPDPPYPFPFAPGRGWGGPTEEISLELCRVTVGEEVYQGVLQ